MKIISHKLLFKVNKNAAFREPETSSDPGVIQRPPPEANDADHLLLKGKMVRKRSKNQPYGINI